MIPHKILVCVTLADEAVPGKIAKSKREEDVPSMSTFKNFTKFIQAWDRPLHSVSQKICQLWESNPSHLVNCKVSSQLD